MTDPWEPWELRAACADHDPELWFQDDTDEAQRICSTCPVKVQCGERAEGFANAGVWAGVVRDSPSTIAMRQPPAHGTEARAKWDRRRGINPCRLCMDAAALASRERIHRRRFEPDTEKRCLGCGVVKPRDEFHREVARPGGLGRLCKPCKRDDYAAWYRAKGRANRARGAA